MITIICPIYNEEKYIAKCIDSILAQDYPKEDMEVLLVDGMSRDRTRMIVADYQNNYPFIQFLDNPHQIVPYAMNIGIQASKGEIIIRLDAHCTYPTNYFSRLVTKLEELNADNVGGVCKTLPTNDKSISLAISEALSNSFGMGNSLFRVGAKSEQSVDTVPFGCFKREIFDRIGLFDEDLVRNQDDEFNGRIIKNGGKIYLIPDIIIEYFARDKISKVAKMYYQYGLFKPLVNKKLGTPATIRQFFPPLFVLGLIVGGVLSLILPPIWILYIAVVILYLLIGLIIGAKQAYLKKRLSLSVLMPYTFLIIHLSYGYGYIVGLLKVLLKKQFTAQTNR